MESYLFLILVESFLTKISKHIFSLLYTIRYKLKGREQIGLWEFVDQIIYLIFVAKLRTN